MASKFRLSISLSFMVFLLSACANLSPIQEFGRVSSDSAGYIGLSKDYARSASTRKIYTLENDSAQRAILDAEHEKRRAQAAELQIYHKTVASYMEAIAELAGNDIPSADPEIDALVDAAVDAQYMNEARARPVKAISKSLADAALYQYRKGELKKLIAEGNAPIQSVLASLIQSVDAFGASLDIEQTAAAIYYRSLHSSARDNSREPVAAEMIWTDLNAKNAQFDGRKKAIPLYAESLRKIGVAHQALYDERNNIDNKQVIAQLKKYTKQIRAAYLATLAAQQP